MAIKGTAFKNTAFKNTALKNMALENTKKANKPNEKTWASRQQTTRQPTKIETNQRITLANRYEILAMDINEQITNELEEPTTQQTKAETTALKGILKPPTTGENGTTTKKVKFKRSAFK